MIEGWPCDGWGAEIAVLKEYLKAIAPRNDRPSACKCGLQLKGEVNHHTIPFMSKPGEQTEFIGGSKRQVGD